MPHAPEAATERWVTGLVAAAAILAGVTFIALVARSITVPIAVLSRSVLSSTLSLARETHGLKEAVGGFLQGMRRA